MPSESLVIRNATRAEQKFSVTQLSNRQQGNFHIGGTSIIRGELCAGKIFYPAHEIGRGKGGHKLSVVAKIMVREL